MKKEKFLLFALVMLVIFLFFSPAVTAQKNQKKMFVDASKFTEYLPKDGAKEASRYFYDNDRQLILTLSVKADTLITICCDINNPKREKKLSFKRYPKNPSMFYCIDPEISQRKFNREIKNVLRILNVN